MSKADLAESRFCLGRHKPAAGGWLFFAGLCSLFVVMPWWAHFQHPHPLRPTVILFFVVFSLLAAGAAAWLIFEAVCSVAFLTCQGCLCREKRLGFFVVSRRFGAIDTVLLVRYWQYHTNKPDSPCQGVVVRSGRQWSWVAGDYECRRVEALAHWVTEATNACCYDVRSRRVINLPPTIR